MKMRACLEPKATVMRNLIIFLHKEFSLSRIGSLSLSPKLILQICKHITENIVIPHHFAPFLLSYALPNITLTNIAYMHNQMSREYATIYLHHHPQISVIIHHFPPSPLPVPFTLSLSLRRILSIVISAQVTHELGV